MPTIKETAEGYIKLRNIKNELSKKHKAEMAPINEDMKKIEAGLLNIMNQQGLQNIGTEESTVYKLKRTSVKVNNWNDCLSFIQDNNAWQFLERRVSKTMVVEYLEEEGVLPPGLSSTTEITIGVRAK
jgi:hypothetical protein